MAEQLDYPREEKKKIRIGDGKTINAVVLPVDGAKTDTAVVLTHGAGGDLHEEQITLMSIELALQGIPCMRFTYKAPMLGKRVEVYKKAVLWLLDQEKYGVEKVIVGGRSMGARVAVELAGDEELKDKVVGALCLSYPLHTAKESTGLRTSGFGGIRCPTLFASGTRDSMCQREVMKREVQAITSQVELIWIDGADHSGMPRRKRKEAFEVPNYFHSVVAWSCDLAKLSFDPDLATNNEPDRKPVAAIIAKRKRELGDDPAAKRDYEIAASVLLRPTTSTA